MLPAYQIIENDLARRAPQPEQARRLRQLQRESGHFVIHAENHRLELVSRGLAGYSVARLFTAVDSLAHHVFFLRSRGGDRG
jgi:hypothetical protein